MYAAYATYECLLVCMLFACLLASPCSPWPWELQTCGTPYFHINPISRFICDNAGGWSIAPLCDGAASDGDADIALDVYIVTCFAMAKNLRVPIAADAVVVVAVATAADTAVSAAVDPAATPVNNDEHPWRPRRE